MTGQRGGYRPGAGRKPKKLIDNLLSDDELLQMSILQLEAVSLRPRIRDMLIEVKLKSRQIQNIELEIDRLKKQIEVMYEYIRSLGSEFELGLQAFLESRVS